MAVTMRSPAASTARSEISLPLRTIDWTLLSVPLLLSAVGLLMIYSSTRTRLASEGSSELHFVYRQGAGIAIGIVVMALATVIDYRRIRDFVVLLYLVTIPTLVAVLVVGSNRRGTQAWFQIGPLQLQPSELAKVVLVLTLAAYCAQHRGELDAWRLGAAMMLAAIPFGLVLLQPDLGTAMVLGVSTIAILLVAGIRAQHFAILVLVGLTLMATSVATGQLEDYQVDRLTGFLRQDDSDLTGQAEEVYNLNQSKIAVASGGLAGKGLFNGTQTQLGFVPEQHTDFIFTAVGEELGFLGGATVLLLLAILVWRIWRAAALASDFFGALLCIGFLAMFAFQAFENIGMTMGIMPITGIPLPFVSYAPSATIAMFAAVGLVANVHSRRFA
jgi:rod shape determining protein RodA